MWLYAVSIYIFELVRTLADARLSDLLVVVTLNNPIYDQTKSGYYSHVRSIYTKVKLDTIRMYLS